MEFNFTRAVSVLTRKFYVNRKSLLIFAGIFFLVMSVLHYIGCYTTGLVLGGENMRLNVMADMICIIIVAGIYPFVELTEKNNAVFELLYPASRLEKFITEFLSAFIFLPICILIVDTLALYTGSLAFKIYIGAKGLPFAMPAFCNLLGGFERWGFADYFAVICAIVISFWGAIMFKKYRLLKTWVIVGFAGLLIVIIITVIMYFNYKATGYWFPYTYSKNGYFDEATGKFFYETAAYYKGEKLDYIPWFFNRILWNILFGLFTLGMFLWTCLRFKKERA